MDKQKLLEKILSKEKAIEQIPQEDKTSKYNARNSFGEYVSNDTRYQAFWDESCNGGWADKD